MGQMETDKTMTCFQLLIRRKNTHSNFSDIREESFLVCRIFYSFSFQIALWIRNGCVSEEKWITFMKPFFSVLNLWSGKTIKLKTFDLTILFFLNSRWQYLFTCSNDLNHCNDYRLWFFFVLPPYRVKSVCLKL